MFTFWLQVKLETSTYIRLFTTLIRLIPGASGGIGLETVRSFLREYLVVSASRLIHRYPGHQSKARRLPLTTTRTRALSNHLSWNMARKYKAFRPIFLKRQMSPNCFSPVRRRRMVRYKSSSSTTRYSRKSMFQ